MNALGWILIILLILVILAGVGLLIYYLAKRNDTTTTPFVPLVPIVTPSRNLSLIATIDDTEYAITTKSNTQAAIIKDPTGPTGPTDTSNICSHYEWKYTGSTGTMEATWITRSDRYLSVKHKGPSGPVSGDVVIVGPLSSTGPTGTINSTKWTQDEVNKKWCLTEAPTLCLKYRGFIGPNLDPQLYVETFTAGVTGFIWKTEDPLVPPNCFVGT